MPRVTTSVARKDIYEKGIRVPSDKTKSGFRKDRSQPHPDGDKIKFHKGETYYSWGFKLGNSSIQHESKTYPKRQQLTMSEFLIACYDIEDAINDLDASNFSDPEDLESAVNEIKEMAESLRDETQDKFDNMPEGLQYGDTGQMLEERVSNVEDVVSELENIDFSMDENETDWKREWLADNYPLADLDTDDTAILARTLIGDEFSEAETYDLEAINVEMTEAWTEKFVEWAEERLEEVKNIQINY